jgi:23S rRNA (adenine2503-C2)-methyltransferase
MRKFKQIGENMKNALLNLSLPQLEDLVVRYNQPKFRAKQIMDFVSKGEIVIENMKNLPSEFRETLANNYQVLPADIKTVLKSEDGNTAKLLLDFGAGTLIETVLMKTKYGNSVCVSSQSGCAMGCKFCASTLRGFARNLSAAEMLSQVYAAQSLLGFGERVSHIVIMGSGEPMLNLDNVLEFLEILNLRLEISWRHLTVSTCGVVPGILKLADWGKPINLAISLHAPNDELRSKIMPINNQYKLADVIAATDVWQAKTKRQLTFEYIVLSGVNDGAAQAEELANLIGARDVFVNLIPYNAVSEREFSAPSNNAVHRIKDVLEARKIPVKIRVERGSDINSACGQLRNQNLG